ncbi:hypothetical protein VB711_25205 [Cronbergia sp. UHCC 0137]|uniref:hypothetical protein n=1 Tax=Cronbergia sp. UHCC 0137 TaxID=3110239 RepID=UPI002B21F990|nr:hypothetical protein [Cronbergia sp. UHCC 0137]MEA5621106.1 hypothetical protein [Cronbergia sp. UHCC 0137]
MKKTYQCEICGHQIVSLMKPSECDVCMGRRWMILSASKPINSGNESMAIEKDLLSSFKFRSTIESYCRTLDWNISSINDTRAIMRFDMDSGNTQTVFIIKYDSTLEFSCPSGLKFDSTGDIPGGLSTLLLMNNKKYKLSFWCIEEIGDKQVFSIMHNTEMSLINVDHFAKIVIHLVQECEKFEQIIQEIINN